MAYATYEGGDYGSHISCCRCSDQAPKSQGAHLGDCRQRSACGAWNDTKAAEEYRTWQARELIRSVYVTVIPGDSRIYNAYVSMEDDRLKPGGGYRSMAQVLSSKELRQKLLAQALAEFDLWKQRYQEIKELCSIFEARKKIV